MRLNLTAMDTQMQYFLNEYDFSDSVQETLLANVHLNGTDLLDNFINFGREEMKRLQFYWEKKEFDLETAVNMTWFDQSFPDEETDLSYMEQQYREWRNEQ